MKLSGSYDIDAPPEQVWNALTNPESLKGCIPGCQRLERSGSAGGEDDYEAALSIALGPIRGNFDAKVSMREQMPHKSYRLVVEGRGSAGFVNGEAVVNLIPNGGPNGDGTTVQVDGDAQAGGLLARVGQRMMESVSRSMMDRFFTCLSESAAA